MSKELFDDMTTNTGIITNQERKAMIQAFADWKKKQDEEEAKKKEEWLKSVDEAFNYKPTLTEKERRAMIQQFADLKKLMKGGAAR